MRRTVKAWVSTFYTDALARRPRWALGVTVMLRRKDARFAGGKPLACVLTYNDARPAPRRKAGGKA